MATNSVYKYILWISWLFLFVHLILCLIIVCFSLNLNVPECKPQKCYKVLAHNVYLLFSYLNKKDKNKIDLGYIAALIQSGRWHVRCRYLCSVSNGEKPGDWTSLLSLHTATSKYSWTLLCFVFIYSIISTLNYYLHSFDMTLNICEKTILLFLVVGGNIYPAVPMVNQERQLFRLQKANTLFS